MSGRIFPLSLSTFTIEDLILLPRLYGVLDLHIGHPSPARKWSCDRKKFQYKRIWRNLKGQKMFWAIFKVFPEETEFFST